MNLSTIKNLTIRAHFSNFLEGTNNFLFYEACSAPTHDKNMVFSEHIKTALNLPTQVNSMYDYRNLFVGIYNRLFQFCVISLCSDVEFFFKDFIDEKTISNKKDKCFFQRFDSIIKLLREKYDFSTCENEINNLSKAFQIRHICIHNMGYIDNEFIKKYPQYKENDIYSVSEKEFRTFADSYEKFLLELDKQT